MPTAELAHSLTFPHRVRSVSSLWTGRVLVVWGAWLGNFLSCACHPAVRRGRGKNRLRDSDNDRTPLQFFHSLPSCSLPT